MPDLCHVCNKNEVGDSMRVKFLHKGVWFYVHKLGVECLECVKRICLEEFEKHGGSLMNASENGIEVNWDFYFRSTPYPDYRNALTRVLMSVGVLSSEMKGNWEIFIPSLASTSLNPFLPLAGIRLYFTGVNYAIEFARFRFAEVEDSWEIRQISEVLSKEEVLQVKI